MLYEDGDRIFLEKELTSTNGNQYTELAQSALALISEADQRYSAFIDCSVYEDDEILNHQVELIADPASIEYYLEPGDSSEIKTEVEGEILVNGERLPVNVRFSSELYQSELDTVLSSNFYDPKLEAMADEAVTVKMDENPVIEPSKAF